MPYSTSTINSTIARTEAIIANPSSAKEAINATKQLVWWKNELLNRMAADAQPKQQAPVIVKSKVYEDQLPRENSAPVSPVTVEIEKETTVNTNTYSDVKPVSARWFSDFQKFEQAKIDAEAKAEKAKLVAEARANHVFGKDKDGVQHLAGDTAVYLLRQALNSSAAKRDWLLTRAQLGFENIDNELYDVLGDVPTLKQVLGTSLKQHLDANPKVKVPAYLTDISDAELNDLSSRLSTFMGRSCTLAELFYVVAREAKSRG